MYECPICQEPLSRSDAQVNEFYRKLLASGNEAEVAQVVAAIRQEEEIREIESGIDSSTDDDEEAVVGPPPRHCIVRRNPLQRPSHFRDYLKCFYSKLVATRCGHCFHFSCLQQWCMIKSRSPFSTCPMCRESINLNETQVLFFSSSSVDSNSARLQGRYQKPREPNVSMFRQLRYAAIGIGKQTKLALRRTAGTLEYIEQLSEELTPAPVRKTLQVGVPIILLLSLAIRLMILGRNGLNLDYQREDTFDEIEQEVYILGERYFSYTLAKFMLIACAILDVINAVL